MFDYDLDRVTKALNIHGFDVIMLLDTAGTILAEKSSGDVDSELIAEHCSSIVQLSQSLAGHLHGGAIQSAAFEFERKKILLGAVNGVIVCGVPGDSFPIDSAQNELSHAIKALL